ncbi:MAG: M28 family peptidase [Thermaerobacter sp.]|nr:M28 family peptidase [Thermaerobacter sp.]
MRLDGYLERLLSEVDEGRLMAECREVSQEVRLSGSPEEERAFRYVARRLEEIGFAVRLGHHPGYVSWPGPAALEVSGLGALPCITHAMAQPCAALEGEILDLGAMRAEEVRRQQISGRIALLDGVANPQSVQAAEAGGAIAEIFVSGNKRHEMIVSPVWGSPGLDDLARLPRTPSVSIDVAAGERLRLRLRGGKVTARMWAEVDTRWRELPLLEADLPAPGGDGSFVLFSGHIDSWYLGAMDNGSANALMLELARILQPRQGALARGLRLCFWSGHSHGRYAGSAYYADLHHFELSDHCVVHVNVDSPGGQGAVDLGHAIASAELRSLGGQAIAPESEEPYEGTPPLRAGDESFLGFGVPALFMEVSEQPFAGEGNSGVSAGGGLGWWWHTPEDTLDKLDSAFLARDARIYLRAIWHLLIEPVLPMRAADAAAEVLLMLKARQAQAGRRLDLGEAILHAQRLVQRAERVDLEADRLRATGDAANPRQVRRANGRLMALSRALGPIRYSRIGPFGQDPALPQGILPGLERVAALAALADGDPLIRHLQVDLVRERNRIVAGLAAARAALR